MGVTAVVIAGAAALGSTAHAIESSAHQRRLAGQAKNRQDVEVRNAENARKEAETQEENRAFSKIQRQRQRALAASQTAQTAGTTGGGSVLGAGGSALAPAAPAGTGNKTTLGS